MKSCNRHPKRYNIIKLTVELPTRLPIVSPFIGYNQKEGYPSGRLGTSLFGCVTNRLPNSNERVHKPDCNSTVFKEISVQKLVTLMATAISIIVNKCGEKVLVLGLTPSISI